jgi:hypothetical protein
MHPTQSKPSYETPTGYVASHCLRCKGAWVRTGKAGGKLTLCLLDREVPPADMVECNKFHLREVD